MQWLHAFLIELINMINIYAYIILNLSPEYVKFTVCYQKKIISSKPRYKTNLPVSILGF